MQYHFKKPRPLFRIIEFLISWSFFFLCFIVISMPCGLALVMV
jgi:hypothetical protein